MEAIAYYRRRYVVDVGRTAADHNGTPLRIEWAFDRAFHSIEDARAYAERSSEDYEHVRVMDRGEDGEH